MAHHGPTIDDILAGKTANAMPPEKILPQTELRNYFQAIDNMMKVFAIRPGDNIVFLTDPLLDRRVVDAVSGIALGRGCKPREFMHHTSQITAPPPEAVPLIEQADFVISTWFASTGYPLFNKLRKEKGQRWIKITYFRNLDVLNTPQARFPVELVGEIIRATARQYPRDSEFDMTFADARGTDLVIKFTPEMTKNLLDHNRWRGENTGDVDGCYVHYLPAHGPNIYAHSAFKRDPHARPQMGGVVFPQWAVGFRKPFEEKIGIEYKDGIVDKVHGRSIDAEILRDMLVGREALLHELGCGFNPKAPRYAVYPAGSNAAGCLHFGTDSNRPSEYMQRVVPYWEEPHIHQDCVIFDATVKAGNTTLIDNGFLTSLRDPKVVEMASKYGDPVELLEAFVE
ncbi:MAG TPA: hypothetical protein VFS04_10725 [Alphaproteobacteria bacterium]|nr:hypothetical protein [Alphaproteobacteria bacterium]